MMLAKSLQSAAGNAAGEANYIESVFQTWLYTGTDPTSPVIVNGIDLSTEGGLIWIKSRGAVGNHYLVDTERGANKVLYSNLTNEQSTETPFVFNTDGFTVPGNDGNINGLNQTYASWTFRKQPKFFDVVTYTGNGIGPRAIPHNLGSAPGCIIVKKTSAAQAWAVYHRSVGTSQWLILNSTSAPISQSIWGDTNPTSTDFYVSDTQDTNGTGQTYVAYLFAHNAGGFGLSGEDNVISCGSFTTDGSGNASVTLGYEPQWLIYKRSDGVSNWGMADTMRGWSETNINRLYADSSSADSAYTANPGQSPTATGFKFSAGLLSTSATYIYIAIRRGPMKVPTDGTSVFAPVAYTGNGTNPRTIGTLQVTDLAINMNRLGQGDIPLWVDRLRGPERYLDSAATSAEAGGLTGWLLGQTGQTINGIRNTSPTTYIDWLFRRAPGFFDEVCYTGTGVAGTVAHNLTVVPELMIVKTRSGTNNWMVYSQPVGNTAALYLNGNFDPGTNTWWNNTTPTASVFSLGTTAATNASGGTFVAYLFATCPGVSKCGSFTGNGSSQTINCGFTGGARFVLIKATSTTGDWLVADSARGIVSGNDPYLELNTTNAEVTGEDWLDTDSSGFVVNEVSGSNANTNGVTYIYLAIA